MRCLYHATAWVHVWVHMTGTAEHFVLADRLPLMVLGPTRGMEPADLHAG
jgi:hypothetical protein